MFGCVRNASRQQDSETDASASHYHCGHPQRIGTIKHCAEREILANLFEDDHLIEHHPLSQRLPLNLVFVWLGEPYAPKTALNTCAPHICEFLQFKQLESCALAFGRGTVRTDRVHTCAECHTFVPSRGRSLMASCKRVTSGRQLAGSALLQFD